MQLMRYVKLYLHVSNPKSHCIKRMKKPLIAIYPQGDQKLTRLKLQMLLKKWPHIVACNIQSHLVAYIVITNDKILNCGSLLIVSF
jgi:hypothetical protein